MIWDRCHLPLCYSSYPSRTPIPPWARRANHNRQHRPRLADRPGQHHSRLQDLSDGTKSNPRHTIRTLCRMVFRTARRIPGRPPSRRRKSIKTIPLLSRQRIVGSNLTIRTNRTFSSTPLFLGKSVSLRRNFDKQDENHIIFGVVLMSFHRKTFSQHSLDVPLPRLCLIGGNSMLLS